VYGDGGRDLDGDDVPDVVVGDPYDSRGAKEAGAVFVYSGSDLVPLL
jgi:hypothetical protein